MGDFTQFIMGMNSGANLFLSILILTGFDIGLIVIFSYVHTLRDRDETYKDNKKVW